MKALCISATSRMRDPKGRIDKALHACMPSYYAMQSLTISDIYALMPPAPKEGVRQGACTSVSACIVHRSLFPYARSTPFPQSFHNSSQDFER